MYIRNAFILHLMHETVFVGFATSNIEIATIIRNDDIFTFALIYI